ncbi:CHAT domain-containing protein, partial [Spirulina sp. CS-785/01]|uniref:CHAT domain-containing protein n=1 Tax=Spirulina sp. CS-785/01 TaxID=3021716 RepID=UPI00232F284D
DWARTQMGLGNAYWARIRGERGENLETAIACYHKALQVRTRAAFPQDWAMTQVCLGIAYSDRIRGERGENLESAIASYHKALQIYTRAAFPEDWARTQMNLGVAYWARIRGERGENLETAIACFHKALPMYARAALPEDWAMTQNNLGEAYEALQQNDKAIQAYQLALEIFTPSSFPLYCLQTGRNLGNLAYTLQDWETAYTGYNNAIRAVEQSRTWATSPRTKRQLIEDALPIYSKMVETCLHLERYDQALLTVERSKSRTLIELLTQANRIPKTATPDQKQRLRQLNREIAALQQSLDPEDPTPPNSPDNPNPENRSPVRLSEADVRLSEAEVSPPISQSPLKTLLQQREDLITEINDPDFNKLREVRPELPDFQPLLTPQTALIEWYLPHNPEAGAYAFIVTLQNNRPHIHYHHYPPEDRQTLDQFNETYFSDYRQRSWYKTLTPRLDNLSHHLHLDSLLTHIPHTCNHLILIPHLYLHLFPLHALSVTSHQSPVTSESENGEQPPSNSPPPQLPLQEHFTEGVRYAPSCQILAYLQNRQPPTTAAQFFAIQNPTQDLPYTDLEVETIGPTFDPNSYILKHENAHKTAFNSPETLAQLRQSLFVHFSCHGGFDSANPLNSALILAGDAPPNPDRTRTLTLRDGRRFDTEQQGLTLREIYANLDLPACRLVLLSACETGLLDSQLTDEYVGLASGFLYAGSPSVVSSFWCVDDFATAFLAIRFYQEFNPKNPETTVAKALRAAQIWMRQVSKQGFLEWLRDDLKLSEDDLDECEFILYDFEEKEPFADKRYWSAFAAIGL